MLTDVKFDEAAGLFVIAVTGEVDADAMLKVIRTVMQSRHYAEMSGAIWDFRAADLSVLTLDGMQAVWTGEAESAVRTDLRVASVFTHAQDGLILHLWQSAATGYIRMQRRHFTDMEAARRWVGGDDLAAVPVG